MTGIELHSWQEVALTAMNVIQTCFLAYLAAAFARNGRPRG